MNLRHTATHAAVTAALVAAVALAACTRTVYVPLHSHSTDTAYVAATRIDTVAVAVERLIERNAAGDTVRITEVRDRWRTRDRIDTVYRIRVDTVAVAVPQPSEPTAIPWYLRPWPWLLFSLALGALLLKRYLP